MSQKNPTKPAETKNVTNSSSSSQAQLQQVQSKLEESKHENEIKLLDNSEFNQRLRTFVDFNSETQSRTTLASHGFYFEKTSKSLKCADCSFFTTDLELKLLELFEQHVKSNDKNCQYLKSQRRLIDYEKLQKKEIIINKEYFDKKKRLKTFENVVLKLDKEELAENGFFILETIDKHYKIKCCYCKYQCVIFSSELYNSNYELPCEEHAEKSPECQVIKLNRTDSNKYREIFKKRGSTNTLTTLNLNETNLNFSKLKEILNRAPSTTCDRPYHSDYVTEQTRLDSFREWPSNVVQQPIDMARAGFYYNGMKDVVTCFYCNGSLSNWYPNEEPITEHARWFPKCPYIKQLKGAEFIEKVHEKYKDMDNGFDDDDDAPLYYVVNNNRNVILRRNSSIDPKTIDSRMDLPSIKKIIKLGFSRKLVKQVIEEKLAENGDDFKSDLDLVKACYKKRDERKLAEKIKKEFHFYISNVKTENVGNLENILRARFNVDVVNMVVVKDDDPTVSCILIRLNDKNSKIVSKIVKVLDNKIIKEFNSQSPINLVQFSIDEAQCTNSSPEPILRKI